MSERRLRPAIFWFLTLLILWSGFAVRLLFLGDPSLWTDEAYSRAIIRQSSLQATLETILEDGVILPVYFVMERLLPTESDFMLRFPNILIAMISIACFIALTKRLYQNQWLALGAGTLLAANAYHNFQVRNARPYALLLLFSILVSYSFLSMLQGKRSNRRWAGFILVSMGAYLTHFFAVGLPLAQYIALGTNLRRNRRFLRQWMMAQGIAVIPMLAWIIALGRREQVSLGIGWIPQVALTDIALTLWNIALGYGGHIRWYNLIGLGVAALGLLSGIYYAIRKRKRHPQDVYWFALVVFPIGLILLVSLYFHPLYIDRYFIFILPAVLLLMLRGWEQLADQRWRVFFMLAVILANLMYTATLIHSNEYERENWRDVAAYLEENQGSEDAILMQDLYLSIPLRRYYEDQTTEFGELAAPQIEEQYSPKITHVWFIYVQVHMDTHRYGLLPPDNPFTTEQQDGVIAAWLTEQREAGRILQTENFSGITLFYVELGR